jgi:hypothetical protein
MHKHKSNDFIFDRMKAELPICPECLTEFLTGNSKGKVYLRGMLIHEALTRVPVNTRTSMEVEKSMANKKITRKDDAASIVGDELVDELEKEAELVGKSDALVYRAEEAPGKAEEECKDSKTGEVDPDCMAKKKKEMPMTHMKESEAEEVPIQVKESAVMTKEEIMEVIKSTITELTPKPVEQKPVEPVVHPLDSTFASFKAEFDKIFQSEASEEEKLHSVQEPFNVLGTSIVSVIKSSAKPKEVPTLAGGQSDLVKALSDVMNPIAQKLDLVLTQLSSPVAERPASVIPPRRSIPPSVYAQVQQPVVKSETPNLRKIIEASVP